MHTLLPELAIACAWNTPTGGGTSWTRSRTFSLGVLPRSPSHIQISAATQHIHGFDFKRGGVGPSNRFLPTSYANVFSEYLR